MKPSVPRWIRPLVCSGVVLLAIPCLGWAAFRLAVACWPYPASVERMPLAATWIQDRDGTPLGAFVAPDGQWRMPLAYDQVSPFLLDAVVAVEDGRFHEHAGVDWQAVAAACWEDLSAFRLKRGASTITMQLHRLRDPRERGILSKCEQAVLAAQIERKLSKREILLEYLNRAPFGGNLVGAGAASWRYFGRSCRELTLAEAALLAGLPQNPNRCRPDRFPTQARVRRDHVLKRMLACGRITADQYSRAVAEPVVAAWRTLPQLTAETDHRQLGSLPVLLQLAGTFDGVQRTSLSRPLQQQAAAAAQRHLEELEASGVNDLAVVVLDTTTAECLASVSLSARKSNLDLTRRARSTGSVIKPLIYAAAFEAGVSSPRSLLRDSPAAWPGYTPDNYDHSYRGTITAAQALAESRNIPALLLVSELGVDRVTAVCGAAGLRRLARNPQRYGVSVAIGGAEATPLEMAEAYATLARGGQYVPAQFQLSSRSISSNGTPAVSPKACRQVLAALSDSRRTMNVCPEAASLGIAWKTGTSSGHRDAWCAAVGSRLVVIVWLGNASGAGSRRLVGAEAAAPLALRLLASMDPRPAPWRDTLPSDEPAAVRAAGKSKLTICSPVEGSEVICTGEDAPAVQRVLLRAMLTQGPQATGLAGVTLWWFVDGQAIGTAQSGEPLWWQPTPGRHRVRVADEQGRSAEVRIVVRAGDRG